MGSICFACSEREHEWACVLCQRFCNNPPLKDQGLLKLAYLCPSLERSSALVYLSVSLFVLENNRRSRAGTLSKRCWISRLAQCILEQRRAVVLILRVSLLSLHCRSGEWLVAPAEGFSSPVALLNTSPHLCKIKETEKERCNYVNLLSTITESKTERGKEREREKRMTLIYAFTSSKCFICKWAMILWALKNCASFYNLFISLFRRGVSSTSVFCAGGLGRSVMVC